MAITKWNKKLIPWMVVDGAWSSSFAISNKSDRSQVNVRMVFYNQPGVVVKDYSFTPISARNTLAQFFNTIVTAPFYGSLELYSDGPIAYIIALSSTTGNLAYQFQGELE